MLICLCEDVQITDTITRSIYFLKCLLLIQVTLICVHIDKLVMNEPHMFLKCGHSPRKFGGNLEL